MNIDQKQFDVWLETLKSRVNDEAIESAEGTDEIGATAFREDVFTRVFLDSLEDHGQISDAEICFFERKLGRGIGKLNAWLTDETNGQAILITTVFRGLTDPTSVNRTELEQVANRALRVLLEARKDYHSQMEPASNAYDMMQRLHELQGSIDRVRVLILVDGFAADYREYESAPDNLEIAVDIWDLRRLFRADSSGLPYEPIEIDLTERLGAPLPCVPTPKSSADYDIYLAVLPGELLHSLYHEYGPRLLELNVRSFLQARGKVNRGIRDTLKNEPARFMAYNNGISATAEEIETIQSDTGIAISRLVGLQIVNGGQTVASIHRAKDRDKFDLSNVFVQTKLTVVRPEQIETLVPLISRFANTQNRVNEADFSANHPFHVELQRLSQTIWAPGEQSLWFYERARGQYQVAQQREGTTPARLKRFNQANPPAQRFDKVKLAKYINTWDQIPHIVSKGGQKNFVAFMDRISSRFDNGWLPDAKYFHHTVAQALIFKRAEKTAQQHQFPAYRANAIAYTVSLLAYRTAGRVDLDRIWNEQSVSQAFADTLYDWMPVVYDEIIDSSEGRNVTEWCKKEACWRHIQTLKLEVPSSLEKELAEGQPLPTVGDSSGKAGYGLSAKDRENIARVMQVTAEEWIRISGWGSTSGQLKDWQVGISTTLAGYAAAGWSRVPSKKQAQHGVRILQVADDFSVLAEKAEPV